MRAPRNCAALRDSPIRSVKSAGSGSDRVSIGVSISLREVNPVATAPDTDSSNSNTEHTQHLIVN